MTESTHTSITSVMSSTIIQRGQEQQVPHRLLVEEEPREAQ